MIELKGTYNQDCKVFIDDIEEGTIDLIRNILNHEVSAGVPVRIMPDTHIGKGIVIGFTMPVTQMINPNYIGVDIGCSVTTYKLNRRIQEETFPTLDRAIRRSIPMGMRVHKNERHTSWKEDYFRTVNEKLENFRLEWEKRYGETKEAVTVDPEYIAELCKKIGTGERKFYCAIGTLGGGNHFIEIGEGTSDGSHYLTIHSGSRNFGLKVCNYHARKMTEKRKYPAAYHEEFERITRETQPTSEIPALLKALNEKYHVGKKEYFLRGEALYEYLVDMVIAQTYARFNHRAMAEAIFKDLGEEYHAVEVIHSMHNFIDTTDWIIRKGAIRAYAGEKMVIPFNMRDGILICEGKSNVDWNCSAPHGAGRVLARGKAFQTLSMEEFEQEMQGIYSSSVCRQTLDESPMAYKDKEMITKAIRDTAVILDAVRPLFNIKAKE